jgi:hypothetical protein
MINLKKNKIQQLLIELYMWVISPIVNKTDESELKNNLLNYFESLPIQISEAKQTKTPHIDNFLGEVFIKIEYSMWYFYLLLNKGRKYLQYLSIITPVIILASECVYDSIVNVDGSNSSLFGPAIFACIVIGSILQALSKNIFDIILKRIKPGDLLRVLNEKDEIIMQKKLVEQQLLGTKKLQLGNTIWVQKSKKKLICDRCRELIQKQVNKNLNNLAIYFIATNYLMTLPESKSYIDYLRKQSIDTLRYIYAFKQDSAFVLFNIAKLELERFSFEESKKYFLKYLNIVKDDLSAKVWVIVLDFVLDEMRKKNIPTTHYILGVND